MGRRRRRVRGGCRPARVRRVPRATTLAAERDPALRQDTCRRNARRRTRHRPVTPAAPDVDASPFEDDGVAFDVSARCCTATATTSRACTRDREMRWLDDTLIAIVVLGVRRPFVSGPPTAVGEPGPRSCRRAGRRHRAAARRGQPARDGRRRPTRLAPRHPRRRHGPGPGSPSRGGCDEPARTSRRHDSPAYSDGARQVQRREDSSGLTTSHAVAVEIGRTPVNCSARARCDWATALPHARPTPIGLEVDRREASKLVRLSAAGDLADLLAAGADERHHLAQLGADLLDRMGLARPRAAG